MVGNVEKHEYREEDVARVRGALRFSGDAIASIRKVVDNYTEESYGLRLSDQDFDAVLDKAIRRALELYNVDSLLKDDDANIAFAVAMVAKKPVDEMMAERGIPSQTENKDFFRRP